MKTIARVVLLIPAMVLWAAVFAALSAAHLTRRTAGRGITG
jgi:hypothetical protein